MFDTRLRYETSATERERDAWTTYREGVPMVDELDVSEHVAALTAKVQSVHAARQPAAPGAGQAAERNMNVRVHVPKLESMPSSATDSNPAGQYTHLLQLKNASSEDKTPDALRAALKVLSRQRARGARPCGGTLARITKRRARSRTMEGGMEVRG